MQKTIQLVIAILGFLPAGAAVDFDREVRPILDQHCYKCHGEEKQKGDLRLDSPAGILRGGNSGEPLFVKGDSENSILGTDPRLLQVSQPQVRPNHAT